MKQYIYFAALLLAMSLCAAPSWAQVNGISGALPRIGMASR